VTVAVGAFLRELGVAIGENDSVIVAAGASLKEVEVGIGSDTIQSVAFFAFLHLAVICCAMI